MEVLERDFFTDAGLFQDPAPWHVAARERGFVWREPHRGVVVLAGIEEIREVFDDPDRFDPRRRNARRHIAFGHGEHFCPGASLARTEACIGFERLLARLDDIALVDRGPLHQAETFIIRGLDALPLRFRRRA